MCKTSCTHFTGQGSSPSLLLFPGDLNVHVPGNYERHSYEVGQAKVHRYATDKKAEELMCILKMFLCELSKNLRILKCWE